jgi:GntR family transcriptional regulator
MSVSAGDHDRASATTITITPDGGSPAQQICDRISGLIATGQLGAGARLPSVRQLAADLHVAPGTVAKAYRMLEDAGLVESRRGAGTRVSRSASAVGPRTARAAQDLVDAARADGLSLGELQRILHAMW